MTAPGDGGPLSQLLRPEAVRERAGELLALAQAGETQHFRVAPERLADAADLVAEVTRANYPDLHVPPHSRWRHFRLGARDLWSEVEAKTGTGDGDARARIRFELAIVSVLLDGGAGAEWRYLDRETGTCLARSEGLAVASLRMFASGGFSATPSAAPLRADAAALAALTADALACHFQVTAKNPLLGLEARARLLRALGREIARQPDIFAAGEGCRLGGLYDRLKRSANGTLPAAEILLAILATLNGVWPSGLRLDGVALGDVGRHRLIRRDDATDGLVPFHKLSQWLAYSLVEPLADAGVPVTSLDQLTGLPEYRNGGLLIDTGVLAPRDQDAFAHRYEPTDELVVEWRALTVALLDQIAELVRVRLGRSAEALPLAAILEGGTWAAGRRLARARRDGRPPFDISSDGTIF
ncbi:MAG: DUF1688 family protein [Alphaproteobacteria bacterium]|jgi:hypothetical protein|nr:DUF1688 family protein [Alphaproteobacteria bacterium]